MKSTYSLKIDAYSHVSPLKYTEVVRKLSGEINERIDRTPTLYDMDERFRIMDKYDGLVQVLTIGPVPPIEEFADSKKSVELAKLANDEMAELVLKYRDRFVAAIALLPMNNIDAALKETDRAINDLGFKGVYIHTNMNGKPLDSPEFLPLYEKMSEYNLPIYLHPWRSDTFADYTTEKVSKYMVASVFGWPYETTAAMTHLVFGGILEKYPNLKFVTHHCGGMVPYYEQRILQHYGQQIMGSRERPEYLRRLNKPPIDYYKMFYNDTAIHGNTPALMCARDFCGADHLLLGVDMPLGDHFMGGRSYRQTINAIEAMDISDNEKKMIFEDNARNLLQIPV
ncbi:amidohydrolase family protein [Chloroflexota bacterium]